MMNSLSYPMDSVLPWQTDVAEDQRFKKWLVHGVGVLVVMALVFPFLPTPVVEKPVVEKQRTEYTRLLIEEKPLPVPPKPLVPKVEKKKPKPVVKTVSKVKTKPKVVKAVKAKPKPKPVDLTLQARKKAAKTGVLAFADDLAAMRQKVDVSRVKRSQLTRGNAQASKTNRNLLTAKASAAVGGISSAALSTETGGVALSAHETVIVDVASDNEGWGDQVAAGEYADYSGRSSQSVRKVMDANKGAIFGIYNRALRRDAGLSGKLLFTMVIEPSGVISQVSLVSSELTNEALVKKILARIKMINFGDESVAQTEVNYSFHFLPY